MADLNFLYKKYGIGAVLPAVSDKNSEAYRFLTEKLREGEALYFAFIDGIPVLNADGEHVKALAFTTEEAAQKYCGRKLLTGYPVYAERKDGREVYSFFADLGVSALQLDKRSILTLSDLTELPDYDGFVEAGKPLRNAALNAALYLGCQERIAGKQSANGYFAAAFRLIREGYILACGIRSEGAESNGLGTIIPYIEDEEGRKGIPLFTDHATYKRFVNGHEWAGRLFSGAEQMILNYKAFRTLLLSNPNTVFVLNPAEADYAFTCESLLGIETALLIRDKQLEHLNREDDDPTPDFLK